MVVVGGHSPKRRRTDNGPPTADSIAQTNETIQILTGQRQNRWMSGYTPLSADETPVHTSSQQTPQTSITAVNDGQEHNRQPSNTARTMDVTSTSIPSARSTTMNLVDYESPTTSEALNMVASAATNPSRKSLEPVVRAGPTPGLPSPVSSDGNRHSPAVPQIESAPRRGPGRPRLHTKSVGTASVVPSNGSPVANMHQRVPSQTQTRQGITQLDHRGNANQSTYNHANGQQPTTPIPNSQPSAPQFHQRFHGEGSCFEKQVMRNRLNAFEMSVLQKLPYNTVDRGRLTILRDAIEREDMLYIVLSQIHSLTATPLLLPQAAARLDAKAFQYLDMLLCPNKAVSPIVLKWLGNFPAPIDSIHASSSKEHYNMHVHAVTTFLEKLPRHWDVLVSESKKHQAPPLMEDLYDRFQFYSPILQTTAFRAVARIIWDVGSERLEPLHRLDQQAFTLGRRRNPTEKLVSYQAYKTTMQAFRTYERGIAQQRMRHQHLPERQRPPIPDFPIPSNIIAAFQVRTPGPIPQSVLQSNSHGHMPTQQHAALLAEAQRRALLQRVSVDGRGSPAQATASQQHHSGANIGGNVGVPIPAQQSPAGLHLLFPHESEQPRAQPTQPDTIRSALHQAHLRSPLLGSAQPVKGAPHLYRYVSDFVLSSKIINKNLPIEKVPFDISQQIFDSLPATIPSQLAGEHPYRNLDETSRTVRLRCAAIGPSGFPNDSTWVEADNYWPENLFLECNGVMLEPRRKLQHNRYLPIDLTSLLRQGQNELTIMINRVSTDPRPFEFALAVEIIGVMTHAQITKDLRQIDAAESLAAIKKSLSGTDDDDDVAITSSNLTIKLFDPYSNSKIFDVPVRGATCLHKDCFDLETFLGICKRERPGWPTVVDCWRCPICRGDVRPHTLVVDGFLVEVRNQLAEKGLLETRAIVVESNGSWKPKEEERTGVRSASLEREEHSTSAAKATVAPAPKKMPEIIEID